MVVTGVLRDLSSLLLDRGRNLVSWVSRRLRGRLVKVFLLAVEFFVLEVLLLHVRVLRVLLELRLVLPLDLRSAVARVV